MKLHSIPVPISASECQKKLVENFDHWIWQLIVDCHNFNLPATWLLDGESRLQRHDIKIRCYSGDPCEREGRASGTP